MALAHGLVTVKPGDSFTVRLLNVGTIPQKRKKGATVGFAEPYEGPVFIVNTAPTMAPKDKPKSSVD